MKQVQATLWCSPWCAMDPRTRPWRSGARKVTKGVKGISEGFWKFDTKGGHFCISCWQPWLCEGWKAPPFGHFGLDEFAKSTGGKSQQNPPSRSTWIFAGKVSLTFAPEAWQGDDPRCEDSKMSKVDARERMTDWKKVEAEWTSGQKHRLRSLSS